MINRETYLSQLVSLRNQNLIKVITGTRRCGKSTFLRRGGEVYAGRADNGEVDFVVMKANRKREYYQVAYTANDEKTLERELSSLERIRDSFPKYLLTTDFDNSNINGIQRLNVIDWLLKD